MTAEELIVRRLREHVRYQYMPALCRQAMEDAATLIEELPADRLDFHAEWKKCTQELRDAHTRRKAVEAELSAAVGYMRNAGIDLKTGAPKATALRTIEGGLKRVEAFLAATDRSSATPSNTQGDGATHNTQNTEQSA